MLRSDVMLPKIGWGEYGGYEGPWFRGSAPFAMPPQPVFEDKVLALLAATESNGCYDAINMYDRCVCTVGVIQWGEACANGAVTEILRLCAERDLALLRGLLFEAQVRVTRYNGAWDIAPSVREATLNGTTGLRGHWLGSQKARAKRFAAVLATIFQEPVFQAAQMDFTRPRLLKFATDFGKGPAELFAPGFYTEGYEGAMRAGYLSFAANLPAVAARRAGFARSGQTARDRCIALLRHLTFDPGIAIYPGRYEKIRPELEALFGVDLPDMAEDLRRWQAITGEAGERFGNTEEIQGALIALGYDVGPSGADGKMGPKTRAAVRMFQEANGLTSDGLPGQQTIGALARAMDRVRDTDPAPPPDEVPTNPGTPEGRRKSSQRFAAVRVPIAGADDEQ